MAFRIGGKSLAEDRDAPLASIRHTAEHWFERKSVVPERTVLAEALRHAVGKAGPEAVEEAFRRQEFIWGERDGRKVVTTREVLKEEMRMLAFARDGRGSEAKLGKVPHNFKRQWLGVGQRRAVQHVLESRDRVILIRGAAGVGKTTMMQEAAQAIEANGKKVFTFAPSANASRGVLRSEGFSNADTVARLLADRRLQAEMAGQVVWIDEAGLLGTKAMASVFDLAKRTDARVILSGDRWQHGSVERGAALRLLEEEAGLVPAELVDIRRQSGRYKEAVRALSEGRTEAGFKLLDELGWVREVPDEERYGIMAADYIKAVDAGKSALIVAPTHREGAWIVSELRGQLKARGHIQGRELPLLQLCNANLTEAERRDGVNVQPGDVLEFHQNAKGFRKGMRVVVAADQKSPLDLAERFHLFRPHILQVAVGDIVRITKNGTTADGKHRLNNGTRYTVKRFTKSGDLVLGNGWVVAKEFGHLDYGYVATSHASQGKTVDHVLIGQSAASFGASSREQFYVSASRGREKATIYTDNKHALLEAISRSDDRLTATEFVNLRDRREHGAKLQARELTAAREHEQAKREQEKLIHER